MVVLLNGSFRGERSNSNYFLGLLEEQLSGPCERVHLNLVKDYRELKQKFQEAEAVVIGMPLYVDGVPAQVLELMEYLYGDGRGSMNGLRVYVISNMGFYESRQARILLSIVKNWCAKVGAVYSGGLAIGAGEMMGTLRNVPMDQGPNKDMGLGIKTIASHIGNGTAMEDIYTEPTGFPRGMYRLAADMNWGSQARKNGVKRSEIRQRR